MALTDTQLGVIKTIRDTGQVRLALSTWRVTTTDYYTWLREDEDFEVAVELAKWDSADLLVDSIFEQAVEGKDRTGVRFLLAAMDPERYVPKKHVKHEEVQDTSQELDPQEADKVAELMSAHANRLMKRSQSS